MSTKKVPLRLIVLEPEPASGFEREIVKTELRTMPDLLWYMAQSQLQAWGQELDGDASFSLRYIAVFADLKRFVGEIIVRSGRNAPTADCELLSHTRHCLEYMAGRSAVWPYSEYSSDQEEMRGVFNVALKRARAERLLDEYDIPEANTAQTGL